MTDLLRAVLAPSVAIAVSPAPVIAVLAMLGSRRSLRNAVAFGVAWAGTIATVATVVVAAIGDDGRDSWTGEVLDAWLRPIFGIGFLVAGIVTAVRAPAPSRRSLVGLGLEQLDAMRPAVAFVLGVFIVVLNPKDLPLTLAGAVEIASADVSTLARVVTLAAFTLVASSTVTIPILGYVARPRQSRDAIAVARGWLERHERTATITVLVGLGALWTTQGLLHAAA